MNSEDLDKLEFPLYFFRIKEIYRDEKNLAVLTKLLSNEIYLEYTPYLTRRRLVPKDKRFEYIELVYDEPKEVKSIVWQIKFNLSDLIQFFGKPEFYYTPHGSATSIGFIDKNQIFTGFESIHSDCVSTVENGYKIRYEENSIAIVSDLELKCIYLEIPKFIEKENHQWWQFWKQKNKFK